DFEIVKVRNHVGFYVVSKDGTRTCYPDILPHGEKTIQGTQFVLIDQAYSFYVAYGKKKRFDVRRGGEYKAVGFGDATTKYFHCTRAGFLPNPKEKSGVKSLDVDISEHSEKKNISVFIGDQDAQMAVEKLLSQKLHYLGFYANYYKGDDDRLVGLFWDDEEAIKNYAKFWYQMVFVPFARINHHNRFITFASGLLADETVDQISLEIFKREWECVINDFELGEKKWLGDMFDLRESWIHVYLTDVHMAGLMRTTSRFESENYFFVRDTQYHIFKGLEQFLFYQVEFCKSEMKLHCSYNRYEAYGLLCRHGFYVLRMNNVNEFPKNYLHKRWLKNVKPLSFDRRRITGASDVVQSEVLELYKIFESSIDRLVHDLDNFHIYKDKMKEFLNQAEIDVPTVLKVNSKAVMSVMLGVDEPEKVLTGNPNLSKVKATGCFSRIKPVAEVTAEELAKRRTCGLCGGKEGHNKRTYTNEPASKKPKVQAFLK
nr:FAR1 DNA binding domain, zinc finger, SWIM-type, MULE transposase domain, FHY3/FAR1 family [Tanacetum cinerariifolium]